MPAPDHREILGMSIRNLYFHVPMWFSMFALLGVAYVCAILYLSQGKEKYDMQAATFTKVAILFGLIGIATGSFWARFTWHAWWVQDVKLNGAAIGIMIYAAYYILRKSIEDTTLRSKISACLLYTSPSPRDRTRSRMPSSA